MPGVTKEVKRYVEGYDTCQRNKNRTEQPAGKLMLNSTPEKPWTHISADFITKLPLAQGYNSILVVVDRLTKMVHFILTMEKTSAEGLEGCLGITCGNCMDCLKALYQTEDRSSRQD